MGKSPLIDFIDDDDGYLAWVANNPDGFVLNCHHTREKETHRIHRATCSSIRGRPAKGELWTHDYIKLCSAECENLEQWVRDQVGEEPIFCPMCMR